MFVSNCYYAASPEKRFPSRFRFLLPDNRMAYFCQKHLNVIIRSGHPVIFSHIVIFFVAV